MPILEGIHAYEGFDAGRSNIVILPSLRLEGGDFCLQALDVAILDFFRKLSSSFDECVLMLYLRQLLMMY